MKAHDVIIFMIALAFLATCIVLMPHVFEWLGLNSSM